MTMQELLERIAEMPSNLEAFIEPEGRYDDIIIRVFTKPKDKEFYDRYYGM